MDIKTYEPDRIKESFKITKSNLIVEGYYNLTLTEQKVLLIIISLINTKEKERTLYRVSISSIKEILKSKSHNFYKHLEDTIKGLRRKDLDFISSDTGNKVSGGWFSTCEYMTKEGMLEFEFSPKVVKELHNLKKSFTSYILKNVLSLKSKYSVRLYEILKRQEFRKSTIISIEELRKLCGIKEKEYIRYSSFKLRVLEPSRKEINETTDIKISYTEIKEGRRIDRIRFNISNNKKNTLTDTSIDLFEMNEIGYQLINHKVSQSKVIKLLKDYEDDYIIERIKEFDFDLLDDLDKINKIGKGKYLYNLIIHKDWINDKYLLHKKRQTKLKEEKKKKEDIKRLEELHIEYDEYIKSYIKSYETLEEQDRKIIDRLVKKETDKLIGNKFFKKDTLDIMKRDILEDTLLNEVKKDLPSFEEWIRDR